MVRAISLILAVAPVALLAEPVRAGLPVYTEHHGVYTEQHGPVFGGPARAAFAGRRPGDAALPWDRGAAPTAGVVRSGGTTTGWIGLPHRLGTGMAFPGVGFGNVGHTYRGGLTTRWTYGPNFGSGFIWSNSRGFTAFSLGCFAMRIGW